MGFDVISSMESYDEADDFQYDDYAIDSLFCFEEVTASLTTVTVE